MRGPANEAGLRVMSRIHRPGVVASRHVRTDWTPLEGHAQGNLDVLADCTNRLSLQPPKTCEELTHAEFCSLATGIANAALDAQTSIVTAQAERGQCFDISAEFFRNPFLAGMLKTLHSVVGDMDSLRTSYREQLRPAHIRPEARPALIGMLDLQIAWSKELFVFYLQISKQWQPQIEQMVDFQLLPIHPTGMVAITTEELNLLSRRATEIITQILVVRTAAAGPYQPASASRLGQS